MFTNSSPAFLTLHRNKKRHRWRNIYQIYFLIPPLIYSKHILLSHIHRLAHTNTQHIKCFNANDNRDVSFIRLRYHRFRHSQHQRSAYNVALMLLMWESWDLFSSMLVHDAYDDVLAIVQLQNMSTHGCRVRTNLNSYQLTEKKNVLDIKFLILDRDFLLTLLAVWLLFLSFTSVRLPGYKSWWIGDEIHAARHITYTFCVGYHHHFSFYLPSLLDCVSYVDIVWFVLSLRHCTCLSLD